MPPKRESQFVFAHTLDHVEVEGEHGSSYVDSTYRVVRYENEKGFIVEIRTHGQNVTRAVIKDCLSRGYDPSCEPPLIDKEMEE